jgi:hypothetical protein
LHLDGFEWILDPESGQIVSSYYRIRYQLHESQADRSRKQEWREQKEAAEAEGA